PKVTDVVGECESANVTLPGPLTLVHVAVSVLPSGKPSSATVPCKSRAPPGQAEVRSAPALTTGASFAGRTVIVTSSLAVKRVSLAVSLSTYVPSVVNVAVVSAADAFAKVTGAGPLTCVHIEVSVLPCGKPSSFTTPCKCAVLGRRIV